MGRIWKDQEGRSVIPVFTPGVLGEAVIICLEARLKDIFGQKMAFERCVEFNQAFTSATRAIPEMSR